MGAIWGGIAPETPPSRVALSGLPPKATKARGVGSWLFGGGNTSLGEGSVGGVQPPHGPYIHLIGGSRLGFARRFA